MCLAPQLVIEFVLIVIIVISSTRNIAADVADVQAKSGVEIESTELALAFPLVAKDSVASQVSASLTACLE